MHIIAGKYKGMPLHAVSTKNTRPTTNRVREAWVSALLSTIPEASFEDKRILDVFAGSGALGLELLSRGAAECVFIEKDKNAYRVLKKNIASLKLSPKTTQVIRANSLSQQLLHKLREYKSFDVVILDPPYATAQDKIKELLSTLGVLGLIKHSCLVSYEHAAAKIDPNIQKSGALHGFELEGADSVITLCSVRSKTYGTVTLDLYVCSS